ncbi:MAG TPA: FAD-dependent oxidoreductase [Acidimicrobiales bacterium]
MDVVVVGAGMNGLATALLLAKDGHAVTVLERDPAPPPSPGEAWDAWERRGVNQFRMLHFLQPRWRDLAEAEMPEVVEALDAAGALRFNPLTLIPPEMIGGVRESDAGSTALTARRPVVEAAMAAVVDATPGITVERGVAVSGLATGTPAESADAVPHVIGVTTESGDVVTGDLVVDTSGRRSPLTAWLVAAGARPPIEEEEDLGFQYYGRHFRSADGSLPMMLGGLLQPYDSVSILMLPADNGTWGVGVITSARDAEMRKLRDNDTWMRVVRSFPLVAHWTEGEPLEDVTTMAKIPDRYRRFVVDGAPVATGVLAVGDSWACTNPSLGRGITMGLMHAVALRDTLRTDVVNDPYKLALAWDDATEATVTPWYQATLTFDRHRLAEITAQIAGERYEPGDPQWEITKALFFAAGQDGDILRGMLRFAGLQHTAEEMLAQPGLLDKVIELGSGWRDAPAMGPSRQELVALVNA